MRIDNRLGNSKVSFGFVDTQYARGKLAQTADRAVSKIQDIRGIDDCSISGTQRRVWVHIDGTVTKAGDIKPVKGNAYGPARSVPELVRLVRRAFENRRALTARQVLARANVHFKNGKRRVRLRLAA